MAPRPCCTARCRSCRTRTRPSARFALFYTGTIGSGAIAPVIYGFLGDHIGVQGATFATALTAVAIYPLAMALRAHLVPEKP